MKTYFCKYRNCYIEKQFIIAANSNYEAADIAYSSEVREHKDGTLSYPSVSDFLIIEIEGCFNLRNTSGVVQYLVCYGVD